MIGNGCLFYFFFVCLFSSEVGMKQQKRIKKIKKNIKRTKLSETEEEKTKTEKVDDQHMDETDLSLIKKNKDSSSFSIVFMFHFEYFLNCVN